MNVLVDTSVWSLALRRETARESTETSELIDLIRDGRVVIIAPIRQELLSGIRSEVQYVKLRDRLRAFPDFPLDESDYEEAANCFNRCRSKGLQGSNTDFLMCAVSLRRGLSILTTDQDFTEFAAILAIKLHRLR